MRRLLLAAALFGAAPQAWAEGEAVQAIRIEGLKTLGDPFVRTRLKTAVGAPLSEAVLDQDVGRLYQTGYFAEVRVRREAAAGGWALILEVVENPLVVETVFRGNKALTDSKLKAMVRSWVEDRESRYVSKSDMDLDVKAVTSAYRDKAYLFARVEALLEPVEGGERLVFSVVEEAPVPVRKIRFTGNKAYSARKLKKEAPVQTKKKLWFFRPGSLDLEVLQDDADRIRDHYRAHGWLDASVRTSQQIDVKRQRTEITFEIQEGERYRFGKVSVAGNALVGADALMAGFKIRSGRPYHLDHVEHDVEKIRESYGNLGHLVAQAVPRYHYDAVGKSVDVAFEIQEGPKVRIRRVEVQGNVKTRDKVVRRQMALHPGEDFNYAKLKKTLKRLQNTRFFETASPRLEETGDPASRDLILEVKEAKTGKFSYGAGFSDEAGVFGLVRISQSNFDSHDLRQFPWNTGRFFLGDSYVGGGQGFSLSATPGQKLTSYDLAYSEPWLYDRPVGLAFNLFLRTRDLLDYVRRDQGGSITLTRRFGEKWMVGNTLSTTRVTVSGVSIDAPQSLKDSEGSVSVNAMIPFIRYDTRDDPYLPSDGQYDQVAFEHAGAPLFGGTDFWRMSNDYARFWTLKQDEDEKQKHILSFSARAGVVQSHHDTGELPVFLQYFAGGASTIRGFTFNSVGPRDGDVVVGGRFLFLTNLEYTFPLYEEVLRGALFFDRGSVQPSIRDAKFVNGQRSAAGAGIRVHLPISPLPISFDFAFPVESESGDSTKVFTFNFGTVF